MSGLTLLGLPAEQPDWHRIDGEWRYTTSVAARRAQEIADRVTNEMGRRMLDEAKRHRPPLRMPETTPDRISLRDSTKEKKPP